MLLGGRGQSMKRASSKTPLDHCALTALIASALITTAGCGSGESKRADDANSDGVDLQTTITFGEHIAPIMFAKCHGCHREGASAPFTLASYEDAVQRARQIAEVTATRYMPPWLPQKSDLSFQHDRRLSDAEIGKIKKWVDDGALLGDAGQLPKPPSVQSEWQNGEPDLIIEMERPYQLAADGRDEFRNFVIPIPVNVERFVRAVELRPSNPAILHHAVMLIDRTRSSRDRDAQDPRPGFEGMFATNARHPDGHFLGWTPGNLTELEDPSFSWRLPANSDLVLQAHLQPSGKPEQMSARIGFYFSDEAPSRTASLLRLGQRNLDIPAGEPNYEMHDQFVLPTDVELRSIYPHAHYLAKTMRATAVLPNKTSILLFQIDDWDFNWQDDYTFEKPVKLPRGTIIRLHYVYDNSSENIRNPFQPPRRVVIGPNTTDEMGDLLLQLVAAKRSETPRLNHAIHRKDVLEDLRCYQTLVAARPDDPDNHNELGIRYRNTSQPKKAEHHFLKALLINADYEPAHTNLGALYGTQQDYSKALRHLARAVQLSPKNATAWNNLGTVYRRKRDVENAIKAFRISLRHAPEYAMAHLNLGLTLASTRDYETAAHHLREALRIRPDLQPARIGLQKVQRLIKTP